MKSNFLNYFLPLFFLVSCASEDPIEVEEIVEVIPEPVFEYGFCIDSFKVVRDTV